MAKRLMMTGVCVLLVAGFAGAQEDGGFWLKKAKVGDYVVFKLIGSPGTETQEVIAVTDKDVTIRFTSVFNGLAQKPLELTFSKDPKVDPSQKAKNLKIVETGTGQETLKIGGKDYLCDWRSNKITATAGDMVITSESKIWNCKDAPVFGLVKTETTSGGVRSGMELTEAGNKK
jgi:hypothetical protein